MSFFQSDFNWGQYFFESVFGFIIAIGLIYLSLFLIKIILDIILYIIE